MANRISQVPVEVVVKPTSQKARVSQTYVEFVVAVKHQAAVSQVYVEVLSPSVPANRPKTQVIMAG